jgi:hypothetical protein
LLRTGRSESPQVPAIEMFDACSNPWRGVIIWHTIESSTSALPP